MDEDVKGASVVIAIIAMLVGGLVGFAFGINDDGTANRLLAEGKSQIDSPAAKLQNSLVLSYSEYYESVFDLLQVSFEDRNNVSYVRVGLDESAQNHAGLISETFNLEGLEYEEALLEVNGLYADYAEAVREEDEEINLIREEINSTIEERASIVSETTTAISSRDFQNDLTSLNEIALSYIDQYAENDFRSAYSKKEETFSHYKTITDRLTRAAVVEFPERYTIDIEVKNEE